VLNAQYNLACVLSLQSAGKASPAASPVAPADAAPLRDQAFEYLCAALDLGWSDRKQLENDPDREPRVPIHGGASWSND